MFLKQSNVFAKTILIQYAFITVTFPLAHRDYVPLGGRLIVSPAGSLSNTIDSNASDLVCPAHNFAQSTTGTPASNQAFVSQTTVSFLRIDERTEIFIQPRRTFSSRAPPQA